ncbi:hypothetical protein CPC08DRAFT_725911, partial [Agrocybe pediades]
ACIPGTVSNPPAPPGTVVVVVPEAICCIPGWSCRACIGMAMGIPGSMGMWRPTAIVFDPWVEDPEAVAVDDVEAAFDEEEAAALRAAEDRVLCLVDVYVERFGRGRRSMEKERKRKREDDESEGSVGNALLVDLDGSSPPIRKEKKGNATKTLKIKQRKKQGQSEVVVSPSWLPQCSPSSLLLSHGRNKRSRPWLGGVRHTSSLLPLPNLARPVSTLQILVLSYSTLLLLSIRALDGIDGIDSQHEGNRRSYLFSDNRQIEEGRQKKSKLRA